MTSFVPATSLPLTLQLQTISDKPFIHASSPVPFVQSHIRALFCLSLPNVEGRREIFPPQGLRGEGGRKAYSCVRGERSQNCLEGEDWIPLGVGDIVRQSQAPRLIF